MSSTDRLLEDLGELRRRLVPLEQLGHALAGGAAHARRALPVAGHLGDGIGPRPRDCPLFPSHRADDRVCGAPGGSREI